ncbi:hypothetical protein ACWC09_25690 [Streptomyces sp. NPDC001617]
MNTNQRNHGQVAVAVVGALPPGVHQHRPAGDDPLTKHDRPPYGARRT